MVSRWMHYKYCYQYCCYKYSNYCVIDVKKISSIGTLVFFSVMKTTPCELCVFVTQFRPIYTRKIKKLKAFPMINSCAGSCRENACSISRSLFTTNTTTTIAPIDSSFLIPLKPNDGCKLLLG